MVARGSRWPSSMPFIPGITTSENTTSKRAASCASSASASSALVAQHGVVAELLQGLGRERPDLDVVLDHQDAGAVARRPRGSGSARGLGGRRSRPTCGR